MTPKVILYSWVSELWIYIIVPVHLYMYLHFILYLHVWIRIRIHSEYRSGSRKLLNTDPIRIRIHNTNVWYLFQKYFSEKQEFFPLFKSGFLCLFDLINYTVACYKAILQLLISQNPWTDAIWQEQLIIQYIELT